MIIVRVSQGLGNQMFQYAFGECLAKKNNTSVMYDDSFISSKISGRNMRSINEIFLDQFHVCTLKDIRKYTGKMIYKIPLLYDCIAKNERLFCLINGVTWKFRIKRNQKLIQEPEYWNVPEKFVNEIIEMNIKNGENYYFYGFWESIKYIEQHREYLQKRFCFRVDKEKFSRIIEMMDTTESVSIHIRRGDYITKSNNDIRFNLCDDKYYIKAIEKIKSITNNPKFYVFSDDIPAAKKILENEKNCVYIEENKDFEDMFLMTQCKHNILANSTFSFWGAFLNKNRKQCVIAPKIQYLKKIDGKWKRVLLPVLKDWTVVENVENDNME